MVVFRAGGSSQVLSMGLAVVGEKSLLLIWFTVQWGGGICKLVKVIILGKHTGYRLNTIGSIFREDTAVKAVINLKSIQC